MKYSVRDSEEVQYLIGHLVHALAEGSGVQIEVTDNILHVNGERAARLVKVITQGGKA